MDTKAVYNQIADIYTKENEDRAHMADDIKRFASSMPKNAKVVDLGCGVGYDSRELALARSDLQITGIDNSVEMLKRFHEITNGLPSTQEDMMRVNFNKESLGGVWMNASILHLSKEDGKTLLKKIISWLKPGGYLYLQVKQGDGEKEVPASKYGRSDLSRFYSFYEEDELKELLSGIGFKVDDINKDNRRNEVWLKVFANKPL